ncbi:MAG: FtsW/RodA/SpoVE family cell cycle protein [Oscillospiraceae bacterium]
MDNFIQGIAEFFAMPALDGATGSFLAYFVYFSRFMLAITAVAILFRCGYSMLRGRYEPEVWGYLDLPDGSRVPLRHWECTVGRARSCDVVVNSPTVSRSHLVLIRDEQGNWTVYDIGSKGGTAVNNQTVSDAGALLSDGDILSLANCELKFFNLTGEERGIIAKRRSSPGKLIHPGAMFRYISIFQILLMISQVYYAKPEFRAPVALAFVALFSIMWLYFIVMRSMGRTGFEVEAIAFFLCSIGLSVAASSTPDAMLKQIILILAGMALFLVLGWWLRDLKRVKSVRFLAGLAAIGLLALNIVLGTEKFGAKNWISIGGFSLQPSEFVKILYIFAGAATMDRLYRGRNLFMYIAFSAVCVGALAIMGDFGGALVFFATFLVISFMRSGNIGTVILAISGAGLAGFLAFSIKPHIARRFMTWGHVWEDINGTGYQQTRAMSAASSGGLFGAGAGNGWLHKIVAADTDLVFGLTSEELGLIVSVCAIIAVILLAVFTVKNASQGRSSFYVISGCAAVSMMMLQLALNVFGSLDIFPFTGVTFPFVSLGGSSMMSCWALLAFVKATDTRKNASFALKAPTKMRDNNEFTARYEDEENEYPEASETDSFGEAQAQRPADNFSMYDQDADIYIENKRNLFDRRGEKGGRYR